MKPQAISERKRRNAENKEQGIHTWHLARMPDVRDRAKTLSVFRRSLRNKENDESYTLETRLVILKKITAGRDELEYRLFRKFGEGEYFVIEVETPNSRKFLSFQVVRISSEGKGTPTPVTISARAFEHWERVHRGYRYDGLKRVERFLHLLFYRWQQIQEALEAKPLSKEQPALPQEETPPQEARSKTRTNARQREGGSKKNPVVTAGMCYLAETDWSHSEIEKQLIIDFKDEIAAKHPDEDPISVIQRNFRSAVRISRMMRNSKEGKLHLEKK